MNKEILVILDTTIDKCKFHYPKNTILIDNVDIDEILMSSKNFPLLKRFMHKLLVTKTIIIKLSHCYNAYKNAQVCKKSS